MNNTNSVYYIQNELAEAIKRIHSSFDYDNMSGAYSFEGIHLEGRYSDGQRKETRVHVYCTPFWEGAKGICVQVMDENGNILFQHTDNTFTEDLLTFVPNVDVVSFMETLNTICSKLKVKLSV